MWGLCSLPLFSLLKIIYLTSQNSSLLGSIIWLLHSDLFDSSGCIGKPDSYTKPKATVRSKFKSQGFLWHISKNYKISREKFPSLFTSQAAQAMAAFIKLSIPRIALCPFGPSLQSSAIRSAREHLVPSRQQQLSQAALQLTEAKAACRVNPLQTFLFVLLNTSEWLCQASPASSPRWWSLVAFLCPTQGKGDKPSHHR